LQERASAYVVSFLPGCKAEVQNLKILLHDPAIHGNVWVMAKITGFHHTAIRSADFDLSVKFYTEVLGLVPKITWGEAPKRAVMIDAGDGNYVEIFERDVFESGESPILHFAFRTDDCAGMLENARAAGAEVTMETTEVTIASNQGPVPVRIAFFKGPDGEIIELFENSIL
jgi:glyoxylase I family protein